MCEAIRHCYGKRDNLHVSVGLNLEFLLAYSNANLKHWNDSQPGPQKVRRCVKPERQILCFVQALEETPD